MKLLPNINEEDDDELSWVNIEKKSKETDRLARENKYNLDQQLEFIKNAPEVMLKIIKENGEINHSNLRGITPLMAAFEESNTHLISALLYADSSFTVKDKDGLSPLGHAIKANNREGIQCFRQFIADKMIRYSFRDVRLFAITEGKSSLLDLLEPIEYEYEVEVILRSGKKIEVTINDRFTFGELVKHFEEVTNNKSDEFYKGKDFAFRPKDISSIVLL